MASTAKTRTLAHSFAVSKSMRQVIVVFVPPLASSVSVIWNRGRDTWLNTIRAGFTTSTKTLSFW